MAQLALSSNPLFICDTVTFTYHLLRFQYRIIQFKTLYEGLRLTLQSSHIAVPWVTSSCMKCSVLTRMSKASPILEDIPITYQTTTYKPILVAESKYTQVNKSSPQVDAAWRSLGTEREFAFYQSTGSSNNALL
jgi:hypothetical protein